MRSSSSASCRLPKPESVAGQAGRDYLSQTEDAVIETAMRADPFLDKGEMGGYLVWKRIVKAVEEILRQGRRPRDSELGMIPANVIHRVFKIRFGEAAGSAFTIDVEGRQYLVTAKHVVQSIGEIDEIGIFQIETGSHIRLIW